MWKINSKVWTNGASKDTLVTIGVTHYQARLYGMQYDMLTPRIAYFLIGILSKSFVVKNRFWSKELPDFDRSYKNLIPQMVRSGYYMMPLYNLMNVVPYHLWVFNRHVWYSALPMLSSRHITAHSLLYILMYITLPDTLPEVLTNKILDLLQHSLLKLTASGKPIQSDDVQDHLYAALMYRSDIPEKDFFAWARDRERTLLEFGLGEVSDYRAYLLKLLHQ
jgi:hypothetical protein